MLAANKEQRVRQIIEKHGQNGWLRVQECANKYAKDPITGTTNRSLETDFYRIRKRIEKGKVEGFKVQLLPGNVSYIGLSSADPSVIEKFISQDKKTSRNIKTSLGFFGYLDKRAERTSLEREQERKRPTINMIKTLALFEHGKSLCANRPDLCVKFDEIIESYKNGLRNSGIEIT